MNITQRQRLLGEAPELGSIWQIAYNRAIAAGLGRSNALQSADRMTIDHKRRSIVSHDVVRDPGEDAADRWTECGGGR